MIVLGSALVALLAFPATAGAEVKCVYDAATRTATLDLRPVATPSEGDWRASQLERLPDAEGGLLLWHSWGYGDEDVFGANCGAATVQNTDVVYVIGNAIDETFRLDQDDWDGEYAPFAGSGIVFRLDLDGPAVSGGEPDRLYVDGSDAADTITVGADGIALDAVGTLLRFESPIAFLELDGEERADQIRGQGGNGTGASPSFRMELIGGKGRDILIGGLAADTLVGNSGSDTLTGGAGKDVLKGGAGSDTFYARDGERDTIDGGPDSDRAQIDGGLDWVERVEAFF